MFSQSLNISPLTCFSEGKSDKRVYQPCAHFNPLEIAGIGRVCHNKWRMLWYYYPGVDPENLRPKNYLQRYIIVPYPRNKIFLAKITQYHQLLFYFENNVSQMKSPKDLVWENIVKISQFVVLISNVMCNFFQNPQHIPWTFSFRNILSNIHC